MALGAAECAGGVVGRAGCGGVRLGWGWLALAELFFEGGAEAGGYADSC
ncbi:hypothetical protein EV651_11346 [Kribbella sp. VKM Ac-2571]|nr:hypothetical protein EV651_11346 [Kribbella sp. VKM Ac-2571]